MELGRESALEPAIVAGAKTAGGADAKEWAGRVDEAQHFGSTPHIRNPRHATSVVAAAMARFVPGPGTNRRGCFILLAVFAILVLAIGYVALKGKPEPPAPAVPVM
jgi:hypothetical protein